MSEPVVYYSPDGTILAVCPARLSEQDVKTEFPPDTGCFPISKAEEQMFQNGLVGIPDWRVTFDYDTHEPIKLDKRSAEFLKYRADVWIPMRHLSTVVDPEVIVVHRDDRFWFSPGPKWRIVKGNDFPHRYALAAHADPHVLYGRDEFPAGNLIGEIELFRDLLIRPKWGEFTIFMNPGLRCGVKRG